MNIEVDVELFRNLRVGDVVLVLVEVLQDKKHTLHILEDQGGI